MLQLALLFLAWDFCETFRFIEAPFCCRAVYATMKGTFHIYPSTLSDDACNFSRLILSYKSDELLDINHSDKTYDYTLAAQQSFYVLNASPYCTQQTKSASNNHERYNIGLHQQYIAPLLFYTLIWSRSAASISAIALNKVPLKRHWSSKTHFTVWYFQWRFWNILSVTFLVHRDSYLSHMDKTIIEPSVQMHTWLSISLPRNTTKNTKQRSSQ